MSVGKSYLISVSARESLERHGNGSKNGWMMASGMYAPTVNGDIMRHWRRTLQNLWIDKRCDTCKDTLEVIETGLLKRTDVIVITFDPINRSEQHIAIFDTTVARDREFTIGELV